MPQGLAAALVGALVLAALNTLGDFVWARIELPHHAVYGLAHGALLLLALGLYLGVLRGRPARGALLGAATGLLAAASFYVLAPFFGKSAMLLSWMALWLGFAWVDGHLRGAVKAADVLARGTAAAVGSGLAFWAISGIWFNPAPGGPSYAWNFLCWVIAFLPGFAALLLRGKNARSA